MITNSQFLEKEKLSVFCYGICFNLVSAFCALNFFFRRSEIGDFCIGFLPLTLAILNFFFGWIFYFLFWSTLLKKYLLKRIFFWEGVLLVISLFLSVFYIVFSPFNTSCFELWFLSGLYFFAKISLLFEMTAQFVWTKKIRKWASPIFFCLWIVLLLANRFDLPKAVPWEKTSNLLDRPMMLDSGEERIIKFLQNDPKAVGSSVGILWRLSSKKVFTPQLEVGQVDVYYDDGPSDSFFISLENHHRGEIFSNLSLALPPDISVKPPYFALDYHVLGWSENRFKGHHVSRIRIKNLSSLKLRLQVEGIFLKDV